MRGNIAIRLLVAFFIIGFASAVMHVLLQGRHVTTELPKWNIEDLPMQLGEWKGKDTELDQRLYSATGAHTIVNRSYTNESGTTISVHFAVFIDPDTGIWHCPVTCYRSAGWTQESGDKIQLQNSSDAKHLVSLSTWKKSSGDNVVVVYWYQLGECRLYDRFDLGWSIRWKMVGRKAWPAMFKVLLSSPPGSKPEETQAQILNFADLMYQWINQPQHDAEGTGVKSDAPIRDAADKTEDKSDNAPVKPADAAPEKSSN
jgi:EpsI family protein